MMYREVYWASEGYLWEMVQKGGWDAEQMERDFRKLTRIPRQDSRASLELRKDLRKE